MDNAFIEKIKEVVGEKYVKENESHGISLYFQMWRKR